VRLHAWFNEYIRHEAKGSDELRVAYNAEHGSNRKQWVRWLPYAAAFAIALTAAWFFWGGSDANVPAGNLAMQSEDIAPGRNRATLSFADGRTIDLNDGKTGIVVGERISYLDGSEVSDIRNLATDIQDNGNCNLSSNTPCLMSLKTPKGGTYQITLPDGTKVWLNAASTLKYPSRFEGDERIVEIEGEGYFSVVRDKGSPFKVISKGQEIEVLGTKFNIAAYPDDHAMKTTLVEGKVKVSSLLQASIESVLIPGQQAVTQGANIEVHTVDIAQYIAWKDGNFHFDNISLAEF